MRSKLLQVELLERPWRLYGLAIAVRLAAMAWGQWQDAHFPVRYTDIDYDVFTDAASHVAAGHSPFLRHTYRYTPLLAYIMLPSALYWPPFGKLLFSLADVAAGRCIELVLRAPSSRTIAMPPSRAAAFACLWLFNPLAVNICTRGSSDAISIALVLLAVRAITSGAVIAGAVSFGLVVHMRVYPIIYAPAFVFFLAGRSGIRSGSRGGSQKKEGGGGGVS
ncbi:unnamed protein product, partial [Phaeothamnion confervicola]